jgi:hypothetical protein
MISVSATLPFPGFGIDSIGSAGRNDTGAAGWRTCMTSEGFHTSTCCHVTRVPRHRTYTPEARCACQFPTLPSSQPYRDAESTGRIQRFNYMRTGSLRCRSRFLHGYGMSVIRRRCCAYIVNTCSSHRVAEPRILWYISGVCLYHPPSQKAAKELNEGKSEGFDAMNASRSRRAPFPLQ